MADWRKMARALALGDGRIEEREATILRREILADRKVDRDQLEFLVELRKEARSVAPSFDQFFFQVLKKVVLIDGKVSSTEALWLRQLILADNRVSAEEKQFLDEVKREAREVSAEFLDLYDQCQALWSRQKK
jgi:uncharacterized tellurite resistance protein B-like protein